MREEQEGLSKMDEKELKEIQEIQDFFIKIFNKWKYENKMLKKVKPELYLEELEKLRIKRCLIKKG